MKIKKIDLKKLKNQRDYVFFIFILSITTLLLMGAIFFNELENTLLRKKEQLLNTEQEIRRYIADIKRLEQNIEKFNIKVYKKDEANTVLLKFIENLRRQYDTNVEYIKDKNNHIESKITLNLSPSNKTIKRVLKILTNTNAPTVKIVSLQFNKTDSKFEIILRQPYMELNSGEPKENISEVPAF